MKLTQHLHSILIGAALALVATSATNGFQDPHYSEARLVQAGQQGKANG